jgi:phosphoribosylanthranilate isomerase
MMAPSFLVKVCGVTRREDAEAAVEAGASALGFVFYAGSPRCVTPSQAAAAGDGLGVWTVGVFVNETAASVAAVMRAAKLDIAQIYGGGAPAGVRVWRAFRATQALNHGLDAAAAADAEAVLLDGPASGVSFDWTKARGAAPKLILAGGLDASNVAEAIRIARPWGVDASSRLESAPGIKDHAKVRQFVTAALEAAAKDVPV